MGKLVERFDQFGVYGGKMSQRNTKTIPHCERIH